jgi:hypothetical protein
LVGKRGDFMTENSNEHPKVFISYCQQDKEFSDSVLEFSNRLRSDGIDTILDQYIQSPPEGWPRWMANNITDSDFVIMICTQEYNNRVMGKTKTGVGRGVKWEGNLIYQQLYIDDSLNTRFIPVIFNKEDEQYIPLPAQGATNYYVSNEEEYEALYWRLRGVNPKVKPVLGKLKPLQPKERKSLFVSSLIDIDSWNKAVWRGAAFLLDPQNSQPPCLMLPFLHEEFCVKIFEDWENILGKEDKYEELRIAIIEGDIPGEEKGYSLHISSNWDGIIRRCDQEGLNLDETLILTVSRMHRANPTDGFKMYNLFKNQYLKHKKYTLMPCVIDERMKRIKPLFDYTIKKKELIFKNVSEIDQNDQDFVVISKNKPRFKYK